ncbi:MAG: hypothetical protein V2I26_07995 [Halieaceae bacterium]|jgi:hypothetical protein|nr:hypothetical protein [Halieaceae bacterium]
MRYSSEVRWILHGSVPGEVVDWFDSRGPVTKEPPRTDYYVNLGGSPTASIKLRGDQLEFKAMCPPAPEPLKVGRVEGLRNQWVKWTCSHVSRQQLDDSADRAGWLAVWKSRFTRHYRFDAGDPRAAVPAADSITTAQGCFVELTSMVVARIGTINDQPGEAFWEGAPQWWSLAFEAYGNRPQIADYLRHTAGTELYPPPPARLDEEVSDAYPAWLASQSDNR